MLRLALFAVLAAGATAATPDPVDLARRSIAANKDNETKARQYTHHEYKVDRSFEASGQESERETETWDVIALEGSTYRQLILRNDKPLAPKEQKREDERLRREAERRRKETPDQRRRRTLSLSYSYFFPYSKMLDIYDFRYVGEEVVAGHPTDVIEGTPKPDFNPKTPDEKESLNYLVKLWLVKDVCQHARIQLEVVGDKSRMKKGSVVRFDSLPHDDGVWLTDFQTFRYSARLFRMINARGEQTITYSDYRKFRVDSRLVDTPEK